MNIHKSGNKPGTPVGRGRPTTQTVRPPSPKIDQLTRRPAAGSPGPKIPASSRSNSRKSPSNFVDQLQHERAKGKSGTELNDQILLSLSQHERCDMLNNEQQSIFERSVIGDPALHNMIERQKATQRLTTKHSANDVTSPLSASPSFGGKDPSAPSVPAVERDTTESTAMSALTDELTCESDDCTLSDHTHPAAYHGEVPAMPRPVDSTAELMMRLTDEQLSKLLELMTYEQDRRANDRSMNSEINLAAIENRKNMRRSKSGGSESAFYHSSKLGPSPSKGTVKSNKVEPTVHSLSVDIEDAELLNAFGAVADSSRGVITPNNASRAVSRGSGAHQMLEKMYTRTCALSCVTPPPESSPQVTSNTNSACNSALPMAASSPQAILGTQFTNSPMDFSAPSASSSRPASRLSGMIHLQSLLSQDANSPAVPVPIARRANKRGVVSAASKIEDVVGSVCLDDIHSVNSSVLERQGSDGSVVSCGRDFMLSPSSAFDDYSVGSQSISSTRSSKARRRLERLDSSPPIMTAKHMEGSGRHNMHTTFQPSASKLARTVAAAPGSDKKLASSSRK